MNIFKFSNLTKVKVYLTLFEKLGSLSPLARPSNFRKTLNGFLTLCIIRIFNSSRSLVTMNRFDLNPLDDLG